MPFFKAPFSPSLIFLSPRYGFKAVKIKDDTVLFFGGGCSEFRKDVVLYNIHKNSYQKFSLKANSETKVDENDSDMLINGNDTFSGLAGFDMVYLSNEDKVLIFGGINESYTFTNDLYELENYADLTIVQAIGDTPCARIGHTFTKITETKILLFGGVEMRYFDDEIIPNYLNDLYVLHIEESGHYRWEIVETSPLSDRPCPRESHTAVLYDNSLVIHGGMNGIKRLNDTWIFDILSLEWFEVKTIGITPIGRSMHTATLVDDKMIVFGGFVHDRSPTGKWKCTNGMQILDLKTMKYKSPSLTQRPEPRAGHAAIENHGRIFFWSGRNDFDELSSIKCYNDAWCFEAKKPPKVSHLKVVSCDKTSFKIEWDPSINSICYVVEMKENCEIIEKFVPIDTFIEEIPTSKEHPLNIVVNKKPERFTPQTQDDTKLNSKIMVHEIKLLTSQDKIDVEELYRKFKVIKVSPSDLIHTKKGIQYASIDQLDGSNMECESTDSEIETHLASDTKNTSTRNNNWYLSGIFKDTSANIKNYTLHVINKTSITSNKIPNLIGSKQISLEAGKTYCVRISALNSCGISEVSEMVKVKMREHEPIYDLKLEQMNEQYILKWCSSLPNIEFCITSETHLGDCSCTVTIYRGTDNFCAIPVHLLDRNQHFNEHKICIRALLNDETIYEIEF